VLISRAISNDRLGRAHVSDDAAPIQPTTIVMMASLMVMPITRQRRAISAVSVKSRLSMQRSLWQIMVSFAPGGVR